MIVPAITRKSEIIDNINKIIYSDKMFYLSGSVFPWVPNIQDDCCDSRIQYAVINKNNNVVGYIDYNIDWYSSCARNFAIISFDNSGLTGITIFHEIKKLIVDYKIHRIEWRMVGGNPIEKNYDKLCKFYNGNKYVLKDAIKDKFGEYHNDIIYEIINKNEK